MSTKPKERSRYEVLTWDAEKQKWTPQQGVRRGPYSLWGLKRALRKLQECGYSCDYSSKEGCGDPSVSVSRTDDGYWRRMRREMRAAVREIRGARKETAA